MRYILYRTNEERDVATLSDLAGIVAGLGVDDTTRATSLRLPAGLHRAAVVATELGMDPSLTAATASALEERVRGFLRQRALAEHVTAFPDDAPSLASVAARRVAGTDHPGAARAELLCRVADAVEAREPDWLLAGRTDVTVDRVLEAVELVAELVDESPVVTA